MQHAATRQWQDETHVEENRRPYAAKFDLADRILAGVPGVTTPPGGFFLWLPVEDGEAAARKLWSRVGIQILPGAYLSREVDGFNPGKGFVRVALVADAEATDAALTRLRDVLYDDG